jgi:hypothetical protein
MFFFFTHEPNGQELLRPVPEVPHDFAYRFPGHRIQLCFGVPWLAHLLLPVIVFRMSEQFG